MGKFVDLQFADPIFFADCRFALCRTIFSDSKLPQFRKNKRFLFTNKGLK
jgi:hypothetical protein